MPAEAECVLELIFPKCLRKMAKYLSESFACHIYKKLPFYLPSFHLPSLIANDENIRCFGLGFVFAYGR
jgi:hypothetical protein